MQEEKRNVCGDFEVQGEISWRTEIEEKRRIEKKLKARNRKNQKGKGKRAKGKDTERKILGKVKRKCTMKKPERETWIGKFQRDEERLGGWEMVRKFSIYL